jgi:FkbM family methyltransferase
MNKLAQRAAMLVLRPYISMELPGWGRVYSLVDGGYQADGDWAWLGTRWVRGKLHGYEMLLDLGHWSNRLTYFLCRLYDLPTQLVLQKYLRPGSTFIDVGGNEGALSLLASRLVGPSGKIIAFEPNPKPRAIFKATIDRNRISNVTINPIGLGDRDETLRLTAPKINSGEGSFGKSNYKPEDTEIIICEIRRGDDVLRNAKPALIKIDVEGFELSVLKGLTETIAENRPPIVMEMISGHLANCGTRPAEIASFMEGHRYRPFKIGTQRKFMKQILTCDQTRIGDDVDGDILWLPSVA